MFQEGDAVVHPAHGAGLIIRFEHRRLGDTNFQYYVIGLIDQTDLKLMVPVNNAERIGLRSAIPRAEIPHIWKVVESAPEQLPANPKERYASIEGKLRTAHIHEVAEAVRDLSWSQKKGLTDRGEKLLERGVRLLASEIAASCSQTFEEARRELTDRLSHAMTGPNLPDGLPNN